MAKYSAAVTTPAPATLAPFATIRAGASSRIRLLELGVANNAATASSIAVQRATNTFVPTTSLLGQPNDLGDPASIGAVDTTWSTAPTINTLIKLRQVVLPATIGAGWVWVLPEPIVLGPAGVGALVVWNFGAAAASALSLYCVWEE
jgi:hypothetical protein